jgi:hypothetical protein
MQLESSAIAGIMIPDALTPGQYYDGIRADDTCTRPIKRLMLAVLEDAMRCYQSCPNSSNRAQRRLFVEAEAWLMDRNADGPFAFETVCETLGIDPSCLREGLRRWRLQQLDGQNPRRLARRSPVTRVGRISAPLRRRRRKLSRAAAGGDGGRIAVAIAVNGHGNGVADHGGALAHNGLGYDDRSEIESVNGAGSGIDASVSPPEASVSQRIDVQELGLA